jgi:hypothetical protein
MEINYILLAHRSPKQIKLLVNKLDTPNCNFYVHIDKGADQSPFIDALLHKSNVFFLPDSLREFGTWGDIGIVKATLNALSTIVEDHRNGYCILLSGQDYPLKNNREIGAFFKNHYGENFISIFSLPYQNGWGNDGGLNRLNQYKINLSNNRLDFIQLPSIFEINFYRKENLYKLYKLAKSKRYSSLLKPLKRRRFPSSMKPYGGSQWWAFPIETIHQILKFIDANPNYTKYHKNSLLPDELFFHSILMHLKEKNSSVIIKPSITYVNWTRKNTSLPVTFTADDIDELKEQGAKNKLFARKFNIEEDREILNLIDELLLKDQN